jgi:hypothetical protein
MVSGQRQDEKDVLSRIRGYLADKPANELVDLLVDLLQEVDEAIRRRFWERLVPPGLATADLRYPSPQAFQAEVAAFVDAAAAGAYYDDEAAEYYGQDPVDRSYHIERGHIDEYDLEVHPGMPKLKELLEAAVAYDEAGRFEVAAAAYAQLLGLLLPDRGYDLFGVDNPLLELGLYGQQLDERLFLALRRASALAPARYAARAVTFLETRSDSWQDLSRYLIQACREDDGRDFGLAVWRYLERRVQELEPPSVPEAKWPATPFPLKLLIRLIRALDGPAATIDLCTRFRCDYPDLYMPLLEGCVARGDWSEVLHFGEETLALPPRPSEYRYVGPDQLPNLDIDVVRERMAVAQEGLGDLPAAFAHRRAVFEQDPWFEHYQSTLEVARRIGESEAREYTAQVIAGLRSDAGQRPLLCQVHLYDGDYASAFDVVQGVRGYRALDALKLVAKAHLLAALNGQQTEGKYLPAVKTSVERDDTSDEYVQFLRDHLPLPDLTPERRADHIRRAEHLYTAILGTHIAAGSKRYGTAAYYCALLAEIAVHMGRVETFEAWYEDLLARHRRKYSLRGVLDAEVQPVLRRAKEGDA